MGERRHGGPPREERQRCSCRAATSQAHSPLPVNQEVSKSEAARRLIAREVSVSAGANTSSFEAQLCNFSFFFPTERNKKKKQKRLFKATIRSWLLPWIKISWTHSFCFSLIVTNARNVKYIKLNIYIKRFWTSYYHYNLKEKISLDSNMKRVIGEHEWGLFGKETSQSAFCSDTLHTWVRLRAEFKISLLPARLVGEITLFTWKAQQYLHIWVFCPESCVGKGFSKKKRKIIIIKKKCLKKPIWRSHKMNFKKRKAK